jgi:hypothetical protein
MLLVNVSYYKKEIFNRKNSFFLSIEECEDYVADEENCAKFIRCFGNIRIKFTCTPGTTWDDSIKTCVYAENVEGCQRVKQQRKLGNYFFCFQ